MSKPFTRAFGLWLPIVAASSGLFLFSYWAVQQEYRMSLNDPQVQMAEDAASKISAGEAPEVAVPTGAPIDIRTSLAPWIAVYDSTGNVLVSSGVLSTGESPKLPQSVFDPSTWKKTYAEQGIVALSIPTTETRFSWQPLPAVRQAVVLVHAANGDFVASGRNMREVESREAALTRGAALLWGATELGTLAVLLIVAALGWL